IIPKHLEAVDRAQGQFARQMLSLVNLAARLLKSQATEPIVPMQTAIPVILVLGQRALWSPLMIVHPKDSGLGIYATNNPTLSGCRPLDVRWRCFLAGFVHAANGRTDAE